MIKLSCLRATQHEQNLHIRFYSYIHILLQKFDIDFEKCILYARGGQTAAREPHAAL